MIVTAYCWLVDRYNCNRYDEEEAKKARDAQEVDIMMMYLMRVLITVCWALWCLWTAILWFVAASYWLLVGMWLPDVTIHKAV